MRDNKVVTTKKKNEISKFIFPNDIFLCYALLLLANYTFSFMINEKKISMYAENIKIWWNGFL